LTTADFRFKARPWELKSAASLCTQCPVGCNTTLNIRREVAAGGDPVIKRAMPRQNELVNEIWICDKGRFGYTYAQGGDRLTSPMIRKNGELLPASWEEALSLVGERFKQAGENLLTLASGRLSNEDLFNLKELADGLGGKTALYSDMAGGELTLSLGLGPGSNLGELGKGSAILVAASDLEEEAPIWWLRVNQAAKRGATLVTLNARPTKLDAHASYVVRYPYGSEATAVLAMLDALNSLSARRPDGMFYNPHLPEAVHVLAQDAELQQAATALSQAENLVIFYGSDGIGLEGTQALAQASANLLLATGHVGRPNNGLVGVWQRANDQGAWELGWRPDLDLGQAIKEAVALYIVGADPAGDDPAHFTPRADGGFLVVQDLYLTATARLADVVLPGQSWAEREGTLTSGERRVQRYYPAILERPGTRPDFKITGQIADQLGISLETRFAIKVFDRLAKSPACPSFSGLTYKRISEVPFEQWPIVGRSDLYYGGTTYDNHHGLGVQLSTAGVSPALSWPALPEVTMPKLGLLAVPVTRLYDQGSTLKSASLLKVRTPAPFVVINPQDSERLRLSDGAVVRVSSEGNIPVVATLRLDPEAPERILLAPRSFGIPIEGPTPVDIILVERVTR
jgi:NADH-quinone oxidoreductase subunit G